MSGKRKTDYSPQQPPEAAATCHAPGCVEPGIYKAPKSKDALDDYLWFCLDHVREHNAKWDYMAGMESDEIEHFIKDAVTGHRPTWTREARIRDQYQQLQDKLYEFLNPGFKRPAPGPRLSGKMRKALAAMEMDYPFTAEALKIRYRVLVKKHHPDVNKGDKKSEEMFKRITAAYHTLREHKETP